MRAILYQTAFVTVLWGLGMHFLFAWPREDLAGPMAGFAILYGAGLMAWRFFKAQRKSE